MKLEVSARVDEVKNAGRDPYDPIQGEATLRGEHLKVTIDLSRDQVREMMAHITSGKRAKVTIEIE